MAPRAALRALAVHMGHSLSAPLPGDIRRRVLASPLVRERLVAYVFPGAASEQRVRESLDRVPSDAQRYAVLGCGIGWLAWELATRHQQAEIVGFDPDPTSIDVATILFERSNLSFVAGPIEVGALAGYDAVVVPDGAASSPEVAAGMGQSTARIVELAAYEQRDAGIRSPVAGEDWPQADTKRSSRVASRLGIHVTCDGYLVSRQAGPNVLIVMPSRGGYSETFIRAQIEQLPASVSLLVGGLPDMKDEDGRELVPWIGRAFRDTVDLVVGRRGTRWLEQFWLRRFMSARRIDVVLAEYGIRGIQMITACKRLGIPLVTHFYGYDGTARTTFEKYQQGYRRLFEERFPLVVVSRHMAARLVAIGADPAVLRVIACGVDPHRETAMPDFDDPPVFLAVGRFVEKKAPHLTLLAFDALRRDVPEARLRMVGDGPLLGPCMHLARALGIEASVEFLGALPHDQLPALYRTSRAFVQHSMEALNGDSEGMPVAILEAGVAGLPVVATRHAGIPEAVIDGETGYLVPEGGVSEMADQMARLARDRGLAKRLGGAARRHIAANFALDDLLGRLWDVVESALAQSSEGASRRQRPGDRR